MKGVLGFSLKQVAMRLRVDNGMEASDPEPPHQAKLLSFS
jgi:hypothetical protein